MKRMRFLLPLLFTVLTFTAFGQTPIDFDKVPTKDPNAPAFDEPLDYRTLGVDVGVSYQTSDVKTAFGGWGIGLTYEKNMVHQKGGAFDLGLRGRLMFATTKGFDTKATEGLRDNPIDYRPETSYFANYKTSQGELGLEGVLTFNQLREKTGIYATLFGGIGLVGFDVRLDQLDGNNQKYNYKSLGTSPTQSQVRTLHDGTYETSRLGGDTLTGIAAMPSIGGEIGFHVSPKFMIVLGHKLMFTGTDLFDGKEYIDATTKGKRKDVHQYTHVGLKWILGARKPKQDYPNPPIPPRTTDNPTNPYPTTPTVKLPIVRFIQPNASFETPTERQSIRVKIDNVVDYPSVTLTINGRENRDFAFRNGELTADILLIDGPNQVNVSARNTAGSSIDGILMTLRRAAAPSPTVQITSTGTPISDNFGICRTTVEARVENIRNNNDIQMSLNGRTISDFTYDNYTKILRGTLSLGAGSNQLIINVQNGVGNATDQRSIACAEQPRQLAPIVQITSTGTPIADNFGGCQTNIEARIENARSRNDIQMTLNGRTISNFTFDINTRILRGALSLASGSNQLIINVQNGVGNATDQRSIACAEQPRQLAPVVQITSTGTPIADNFGGCQTTIEARVENARSRADIRMTLNGRTISNFTFDINTRILRGALSLASGSNQLIINAQNGVGNANDQRTITCVERQRTTPPTVRITQPTNGQFFDNNPVDIRATVENIANRNQIELYLNGNRITDFVYYSYDKSVSARVNLNVGENQVRLKATNEGGSTEDAVRFTLREKPKTNAPTVRITRPTTGSRITETFVNLEAIVENISDRNGIQVLINGVEDRSFTFDIYTRTVRTRANIRDGQNTLTVRVQNETSNAQASVTVSKRSIIAPPPPPPAPKMPPVVIISSPINGTRTTNGLINLEASATNVGQNQVKVLLNGAEIPFTMVGTGIQAVLNLTIKGENTVTVRATNNDGTNEKQVTIVYNKVKQLPTSDDTKLPTDVGGGGLDQTTEPTIANFNASQPVIDPFDPKPAVSVVSATIGNVTNANQIEFYLNGAQQTNFTFDVETHQLRWSFQPKAGVSYTFNIIAKNSVGRTSKTEVVKF